MQMLVGLIPAAGSGSRMGGDLPKQYQAVGGIPLVAYALEAFATAPEISATYVVLAPDDVAFASVELSESARSRTRALYVGGASRHQSVLNGLFAMATALQADDWVLVHDAARPGLSGAMISELVRALESDPVGGLLALPVSDTLKAERLEAGVLRVDHTVDRAGLWQAQTPQMFRFGVLRDALSQTLSQGGGLTDEASAIEQMGLAPRLVAGSSSNFKVTYPEDLQLAQRLFSRA